MEQSDREHKERCDSGTGGKTRPRKNIRPSSSGFSQYTACQSASRCTSWWWRWRGRIVPATMQYVQLQTTCASKKAKRHTPYLGYNTAESEPNPCFNEQTLLWLRTSWMRALCFSSFLDFMIRTIAAWEKNSEDIYWGKKFFWFAGWWITCRYIFRSSSTAWCVASTSFAKHFILGNFQLLKFHFSSAHLWGFLLHGPRNLEFCSLVCVPATVRYLAAFEVSNDYYWLILNRLEIEGHNAVWAQCLRVDGEQFCI